MSNPFQNILDQQKARFQSDVTKTYEWRINQLDRMERMLTDNADAFRDALYSDFRKPIFEQQAEIAVPLGVISTYRSNLRKWMSPEEVDIPKGLRKQGFQGQIHREPFGGGVRRKRIGLERPGSIPYQAAS